MRLVTLQLLLIVGCGVMLGACGIENKQKNLYDLYELRPVISGAADNDSYYVPPRRTCTTIGDNPSCGF